MDTSNFKNLAEYRGNKLRGHRGRQILVDRDFLNIIEKIEGYAENNGVTVIVTSSYRSPDNNITGAIVKPAQKSNHLAGHAIDINVKYRWKKYEARHLNSDNLHFLPDRVRDFINDIRDDSDMRWGGDFKEEPDPVHIDDGLNKNNNEIWNRKRACCFSDYIKAKHKYGL